MNESQKTKAADVRPPMGASYQATRDVAVHAAGRSLPVFLKF
jgi:hypothetical protein